MFFYNAVNKTYPAGRWLHVHISSDYGQQDQFHTFGFEKTMDRTNSDWKLQEIHCFVIFSCIGYGIFTRCILVLPDMNFKVEIYQMFHLEQTGRCRSSN